MSLAKKNKFLNTRNVKYKFKKETKFSRMTGKESW